MLLRQLLLVMLTFGVARAELTEASEAWLRKVVRLRSSGDFPFRMHAEIGEGTNRISAWISCAPHESRGLILCDGVDGVPLMIAIDGLVYLYDVVGGQILLIRAEPEFLFEPDPPPFHISWGMRADFPDPASNTIFRMDFGGVMQFLALDAKEDVKIDPDRHTAAWKGASATVSLSVDTHNPPRPSAFHVEFSDPAKQASVRMDSFVYDAPLPKWHHAINLTALSKQVQVRAVRDMAIFPAEVQQRMTKVRDLLNHREVFLLRPALRDAELRKRFEKNSPVQINFDEAKAHDEALREPWVKALREQGLEFPQPQAVNDGKISN